MSEKDLSQLSQRTLELIASTVPTETFHTSDAVKVLHKLHELNSIPNINSPICPLNLPDRDKRQIVSLSLHESAGSYDTQALFCMFIAKLCRVPLSIGPTLVRDAYDSLSIQDRILILQTAFTHHPKRVSLVYEMTLGRRPGPTLDSLDDLLTSQIHRFAAPDILKSLEGTFTKEELTGICQLMHNMLESGLNICGIVRAISAYKNVFLELPWYNKAMTPIQRANLKNLGKKYLTEALALTSSDTIAPFQ